MILRRLVLTLGIASALAILVGTAFDLWRSRVDALKRTEMRLTDLALVLAEQTELAVSQLDGILMAVAEDVAPVLGGAEPGVAEVLARRFRVHSSVPQLQSLAVFDPSGNPLASSRSSPPPALNVADRPYFRVHHDRILAGPYVSEPLVSRFDGRPTVAVSRRVADPSGKLIAVVAAYVNVSYFTDLYRSLSLGPDGGGRLFHRDGPLLAGEPVSPQPVAALVTTPAQRALAPGEATVIAVEDMGGGRPGLVVVRALRQYPLVLTTRSTTDYALGPWRDDAWSVGTMGAIAAGAILALAIALERRLTAEARRSREQAELEARWRFALEGAEHGVFDWDRRARRFYRSPRYLAMLGYAEGEIEGGAPAIEKLVHAEYRDRVRRLWQDVLEGRTAQFAEEVRLVRNDGAPVHALLSGMVVERDKEGDPARIIGTVTDVSRVKAAEARLREGEARLHAIVQSAMDAIITVDAQQRVVLFNGAAERMFGATAGQAVGAPLANFIPERFRRAHGEHVERFGRTGETARRMGRQQALWALRADGTEFPIEASISHATVGGEQFFTVIIRDITARLAADAEIERSHAQLRSLAATMHEVREAEQTRIARELHDELGQALTALKMDVDLLESMSPPGRAGLLERTAAMRGLLDFTVQTTRRISADLRPLVLDDLGLGAAAEWLVQQLRSRAELACELSIDAPLGDLEEPYASVIFRVMQESLTNVAKHARASQVELRLEREGAWAVLTVRDDGVGMGPDDESKPRSFGLRGIRERVLVLGGEVRIVSRPGGGTTLVVRVPLRGDAGREAA
jgi:PAS domain S-box-containing protein